MENTLESKITFLSQNLKSKVVGDFSRYLNGTPIKGLKFDEIYGTLNGINKNETQQFDIDFDLEDGFVFYNCFHNKCRSWSHTIHAEHLTVLKKPLSSITDEDAVEVASILGMDNEAMVHHGKLFVDRIMGKRAGNSQDNCYLTYTSMWACDYLRSKGYALPFMGLSVETLVKYGWLKLIE